MPVNMHDTSPKCRISNRASGTWSDELLQRNCIDSINLQFTGSNLNCRVTTTIDMIMINDVDCDDDDQVKLVLFATYYILYNSHKEPN